MARIQGTKPNGDIVIRGATQELHDASRDRYIWRVAIMAGDLYIHHIFPIDTLEWRSAEYEIDPDDRETLLDVVLAEPWFRDDIDALQHPSGLFNAATADEARDFHLGRVGVVKSDHGLYSVPQNERRLLKDNATDPREYIKAGSHIDRRVIVAKNEIVRIERDRVRTRREKQAEKLRVEKSAGMKLGTSQEILVPDVQADQRLGRLDQMLKGMRSYNGNSDNPARTKEA